MPTVSEQVKKVLEDAVDLYGIIHVVNSLHLYAVGKSHFKRPKGVSAASWAQYWSGVADALHEATVAISDLDQPTAEKS